MNEEPQIPPSYFERLKLIKQGLLPKEAIKKKPKAIPKISERKLAEDKALKEAGGDSEMDLFFGSMRKTMKGKCLFCGGNTMKNDDDKFHFSLAHLLAKSVFKSVATNPDNIIELCFFGESCHTNFDNGIITWELLKDSKEWLIIREKLLNVLPLVAMEERKNKLYSKLNELVYGKEKV